MDLRILGLRRDLPAAMVIGALRPVAIGGLGAAVVTGLALFSVQPLAYVENPAFLTKLALLALAVLNAFIFVLLRRHRSETSIVTRLMAALSLGLWLGVVIAGRFIGFQVG
jgi:hypothetical protein